MLARPLVLLALLAALSAIALVRRSEAPDPLSEASLGELLLRPLDLSSSELGSSTPDAPRPPFWRALLDHPAATRTPEGVTLRLGRVLADPTAARAAADRAGELLALEAVGPDGELGVPLWRALLDGPALEHGPTGRTLALYGCRHSADADAAPALEDSYYARLSLADALVEHARTEGGAAPLALLGREMPVKGGVNFEVQFLGGIQSVSVTFDGRTTPLLRASRTFAAEASNDARARAALIAALRERVAKEGLGVLTVEGEAAPVPGGVDLRLELVGRRLTLVATRGSGALLATHRVLSASASGRDE